MKQLIFLCWHHVLHLWQKILCSDWSSNPPPNSQNVSNDVMEKVMVIGMKKKISIERLMIFSSAFANKSEVNDRVA